MSINHSQQNQNKKDINYKKIELVNKNENYDTLFKNKLFLNMIKMRDLIIWNENMNENMKIMIIIIFNESINRNYIPIFCMIMK